MKADVLAYVVSEKTYLFLGGDLRPGVEGAVKAQLVWYAFFIVKTITAYAFLPRYMRNVGGKTGLELYFASTLIPLLNKIEVFVPELPAPHSG